MRTRPILNFVVTFVVCLLLYAMLKWADGDPIWSAPHLPESPGERREFLLKHGGGNAESEAAVARGLAWLAKQQKDDGHWEFDGSSKDDVAATGMALLPFLAAGETHENGRNHKKTVAAGVEWLTKKQKTQLVDA